MTRARAALLSATDAEFARALDQAADLALGRTRLVSDAALLPAAAARGPALRRAIACALIGDAAHVVHPLAGQGVNLGLLDAAALAQLLLEAVGAGRGAWARSRVLRAYERWRKSEVALMATAIEAFDRLLAHGTGPVARVAQAGLSPGQSQPGAAALLHPSRARGDGRAAAGGALGRAAQASGTRSIFAAQMKSFSDSPPIACVV